MADIQYKNVSKKFGKVTVIENISLSIEDGELMVFVGPSGCGKSTLLRLLAGLEDISEGDISIGGHSVIDLQPRARNVAMVFQSYALYPHMTVEQNIAFAMKLQKLPKEEIKAAVNKAAEILGLQDLLKRKPRQLSGGQRQRVAMGRAIVRNPQVFLMDEPLSNLDAKLRNQMRVEIKQLQRRLNTTMIYVTHDQVEAMTLADRIVILEAGKVKQIGTPEEVYYRPADTFVADFIGSPAMNFIRAEQTEGNALRLSDGVSLSLTESGLSALDGPDCIVGIRPEHLLFEPENLPSDALVWTSQVQLVESLGGECLIHLKLEGQDIRLKLPGSRPCKHGDQVRIGFLPESAHLFSKKDGKCLRHGSGV